MDALEEYLCQEGREKYAEAVKLNDIDSANDPENNPFQSKYKAREIWQQLVEKICEIGPDVETAEFAMSECATVQVTLADKVFLLANLEFRLGCNNMETEEVASGQEYLVKCIGKIEDRRLDVKVCNQLQNAYNQMGILWTTRRKPDEAKKYLEKAEQLYKDYKNEVGNAPFSYDEMFKLKSDEDEGVKVQRRSENFEDTFTHTLYYLAQVYAKLEENAKSAELCHMTLRRQLETKKYDPVDWALNAATLSQFYMTVGNFKLSRHCLASAERILLEVGEPVFIVSVNEDDSQAEVDKKEKLPKCWSDLYRCWTKYGLCLLETSMEKLIEDIKEEKKSEPDHNADKKESGATSEVRKEDTETNEQSDEDKESKSLFFNLELTSIEDEITSTYVKVFEDARPVFLKVQKWISDAKQFYVLDGHCTDHVELIQDHSKAFKLLAFFEADFERQCKMHKRRVDMLQAVLKELSTQFYLMICRQLMYEIAETYSAMLDLKLAIIEENETPPTAHAMKKINTLVQQSIDSYSQYIESLKTGVDKALPSQFSSDDERPALIAYFCMGRLYSKFLDFETTRKLQNMKKSLDCYKFLVDYCKKNPSAKNVVATESEICEEMVTLMPLKMEKIRLQSE